MSNVSCYDTVPEYNHSTQIRHPMIVPRYGTSGQALPDKYVIDCSDKDMTIVHEDILKEAKDLFTREGVILLRTNLKDMDHMEAWATSIMDNVMKYHGGSNSRRHIDQEVAKNVYDTGAPYQAHLHYHHEMAYVPHSVAQLGFCCIKATPGKGATWVSDQKAATEYLLKTELGQKLKEKGTIYVRCLTDRKAYEGGEKTWNGIDEIGVYNHWQQSFGVETVEECEAEMRKFGPNFTWEWGKDNYLVTKFKIDAYEHFDGDNLNYLYASLADDAIWFDTWPGVMQLPCAEKTKDATAKERPLKLLYGDESEFTRQDLVDFIDVYDRFGYPINWKVGDVAIVCNWRWAHGRPEFSLDKSKGEERELGVILGPQFQRKGQYDNCWPLAALNSATLESFQNSASETEPCESLASTAEDASQVPPTPGYPKVASVEALHVM